MLMWDPTWKHVGVAPLPRWFTQRMRWYLQRSGDWGRKSDIYDQCLDITSTHRFRTLFDHVGTVGTGKTRFVVLQPYGRHTLLARQLAKELGCALEVVWPGIWNGRRTCTYIYKCPS